MFQTVNSSTGLSFQKLVILKGNYSQAFINFVLTRFPQIRDIHTDSHKRSQSVFLVHLCNLLAASINSTLVTVQDYRNISSQFPGVYEIGYRHVPLEVMEKWKSKIINTSKDGSIPKGIEFPTFGLHEPSGHNLVYCHDLRTESDKGISMFLNSADLFVWISLILALLLTAGLMKFSLLYTQSRVSVITTKRSYIMPIISSLLSFGVSSNSKEIQHSFVFNSWTCFCLIFTTYCTAYFTSEVIRPPPEIQQVKSIEDLLRQEYRLIFRFNSRLGVFRRLAGINIQSY